MRTEWQINDFIPDPNTGKDRWQIYKILKGGMGVVYIVYDTEWRAAFAVKTYQDRLQSEYAKEQFKKEALVWINLDRHENIAWALTVENIHNRLYLFLEYVPGGDLSRWIGTKRLDLKQVLLFALQFCHGMEHALAKGVRAHRDIKPQNCLITEDGTLKITDFGLAKAFDTVNFEQPPNQPTSDSLTEITTTRTGQAGGTMPYMAPEQFEDLKRVDVTVDIYAFGIMLYEMISGHWPYLGSTYAEFREQHQKGHIPDLPPFSITQAAPLADIVRKCLAKKPKERYADFSHLSKEITQLYESIYAEEAPSSSKVEKLSANDLINKGVSLGNLGFYQEALSYCDHALEINLQNAVAWYNKGLLLKKIGQNEEAINCYDRALEIEPKYAFAWTNKGIELLHLGRYEEAVTCLNYALEVDPKYAEAWYDKGSALLKLERHEEAIICCEHALEFDPKLAGAWSNKGSALVKLGRYEEAIPCYDYALGIDPKYANAWFNKGIVLRDLGRYKEALSCYDHALEMVPEFVNAWYYKGDVLVNLRRYEEAITCYEHILEINPKEALAWSGKSAALLKLRRHEEAIFCCDHALEIDPKNAKAWCAKGLALVIPGNLKEALMCFQKALQFGLLEAAQGIEFCKQRLRE